MRPTLTFVLTLVIAILTCGCNSRTAWIGGGARYHLQTPADLETSIAAVQRVQARYQEQEFGFLAQVEATPETVTIAAMGQTGVRAFLIRDDGDTLHYEQQPLLEAPIRPKYLLADYQFIFWPSEAIRRGLKGAELVEAPGSREIHRGGEPLIRILYGVNLPWHGTTRYEHLQRGYSFVIRSQQLDDQ